ncbi:flagellar protein FlgN [Neobacillus sp. NPDC058068]|uniref:flagellar protein FlgN n=1 Tax=Neobacillus sp. NPDC058068 TaxID=3346325 RepID=UPI0036DD4DD5
MNKLTEALQTLANLHETLLETAKKKQQILISAELNPLLSVLAEESKLIKKIQEAEQKRTAILGEQANQLSLAELIEREQDNALKREWREQFAQLKSLFAEIERVNQTNQQLIEQSLTFTNFMIEQMVPSSDGTGVYSPKAGTQETRESVRFFDAKA